MSISHQLNIRRAVLITGLCLFLSACAAQTATHQAMETQAYPYPAPQATVTYDYPAPGQAASATYTDPFAYCGAVGAADTPGAAYTGPKTPDQVVQGLMQASGASADAPKEMFANGAFWRCMDGQVYACFVGANLPCDAKANTDKTPTAAELDYCKANANAEGIPAAVTGHNSIYTWVCKDGVPQIDRQVFQVDAQGYIQEIWYAITPTP